MNKSPRGLLTHFHTQVLYPSDHLQGPIPAILSYPAGKPPARPPTQPACHSTIKDGQVMICKGEGKRTLRPLVSSLCLISLDLLVL